MKINDVIAHLRNIKFVGPLPETDALLVSANDALVEARTIKKDLSLESLKTLLRKEEIAIFNTVDDYVKFKGTKKV